MEKTIKIKSEYNSLESLQRFVNQTSDFECVENYDSWEHRIDNNGMIEKCLVIKKGSMHGIKVYFKSEHLLQINYIIPNKVMYAYFGKSVKARKNIIEIIAGILKQAILAPSQKKAFSDLGKVFDKITV